MISKSQVATFQDPREFDAGSAVRLHAEQITLETTDSSRIVFLSDPYGLAVESYKLLRTRLSAVSPNGGLLLVTSPSAGDGKTLTSTNVAWSFAEAGKQTCLVDLDFRDPGVGRSLNYEVHDDDDGVEEVLTGACTLSRAIRRVKGTSLFVLGVKEPRQSISSLFAAETIRPMLMRLKETFDWVVLDMPPAIPMSDVPEVLPHVDGALMVVRSGRTSKSLLEPTIQLLGNKLWGSVLNEAVVVGSEYYYGYSGYGKHRKQRE